MLASFLLLSTLFSFTFSAKSCKWTATDPKEGVTGTLNLNPIKGHEFWAKGITDDHLYNITMCEDKISCSGTTTMISQESISDKSLCYYVGLWNASIQPELSMDQVGPSWQFTYIGEASGGCTITPRQTVVNFWCAPTQTKISGLTMTAEQMGTCEYELNVYTNYACFYKSSSSSDDLSGGSVFIIILIVLIVAYCLFGYIFNKVRNPENGWGDVTKNTPNYEFWVMLPKYIVAGCVVTKETIVGAVSGGSSQHETIPEEPDET